MNVLLWTVLGGITGWLASLLADKDYNTFADIILGILGAILGGWLVILLQGKGISSFNLSSLWVSILGAAILILVGRFFRFKMKKI